MTRIAVRLAIVPLVFMAALSLATLSWAQDEADLAKKLQNPVASLVSVPLQNNWDFGIGPEDATRYTLNVQPVIPLSISGDWNLITRTIVPVISAEAAARGLDNQAGLGDIVQSFFISPKEPTGRGWIRGAVQCSCIRAGRAA